MKLASIDPITVHVSPKTKWFFVKVVSSDGIVGYGELSLFGWEPLLQSFLAIARGSLLGRDIDDASEISKAFPDRSGGRVSDSIVSALELAFWDIRGQEQCAPLHELWGTRQSSVSCYANINRGTIDRSADGWIRRALAAKAAGFRAVKMAPFDGLRIREKATGEQITMLDDAISKVAAVGRALGSDVELMVDCHWRLDVETARYALDKFCDIGVAWFEAPIPEVQQSIGALSKLNAEAAKANVILAGAEMHYGLHEFEPYIAENAFSVIMPDLRWCGGASEGNRIAASAKNAGVRVAPHNSAGPILAAASINFCFAMSNLHSLEIQYDESPLYLDVLHRNAVGIGGPVVRPTEWHGIGVSLEETTVRNLPRGNSDRSDVVGQPGSGAYA